MFTLSLLTPAFSEERYVQPLIADQRENSDDGSGLPRFIMEQKTEPFLLPFPIRLNGQLTAGKTNVDIYNNSGDRIADGSAILNQYRGWISYDSVSTRYFFIAPEFGFLTRTVRVKDYSFVTSTSNFYMDGFIPGIISDPSTGNIIPKDESSSLAYTAKFNSLFADIRFGSGIVFGDNKTQVIINPALSFNVAEMRKTSFKFKIAGHEEKWTTGYRFSCFSSWSAGAEAGFYFPGRRTGFLLGYERRVFKKISMPRQVRFKEVYLDSALSILRTREINAGETSLTAHLINLSVFIFI